MLSNHEERALIASQRFSLILLNQIKYDGQIDLAPNDSRYRVFRLAKTKYSTESNYLWNKCKYFDEDVQAFYIDLLKSGKYIVGNRVFIDPPPEVKNEKCVSFYCFEAFVNIVLFYSTAKIREHRNYKHSNGIFARGS